MNKIIDIKIIKAKDNGQLSFIESNKDVPFDIRRIYYIYDVPVGTKRGMHAHKNLKQLLWCPHGEVEVVLDNGREKVIYQLNTPEKGLLIVKGYWRDIYFKKEESILCVAASDYYDEYDYIREYDEFLKYVEERYWDDENKI